ncbi:MAG: hypothetical protein JST23_10695 [Bacteroidetes bacterium]|nr:hypothetical protein [Bacteroidota bacterium]
MSDNSQYQNMTSEEFSRLTEIESFSYDSLFNVLNYNEDIEVCKSARDLLYQKISTDFLKNYLKNDYFDEREKESHQVFEFFKQYLDDDKDSQVLIKQYITDNSDEKVVQKAWELLDKDELNLQELSEIICETKNINVQEECWDDYISNIQYALKDEKESEIAIESLFSICFSCKNEIFVSESWRLLKQYEFFNETYLDLVLENQNSEIVEYAWRHIKTAELKDTELIDIIKQTANKRVAHEALDLYRLRT